MEFPCGRRGTSALLAILLAALSSACAGGRSASVPEPPPSSLDDILTNGEKLYSQFDEELIIRHFFGDRREGVFLDVGCGPAKRNSTTYYLEHHLGWSGIGIDALPEWGLPYETERPNTRFYNYIVTDHSGDVETFYRVLRGKLRSSVSEGYSQGGNKLPQERIDVTTITLNELLAEAGVSKIDFLSMDIEGSAPPALAGFDIAITITYHP